MIDYSWKPWTTWLQNWDTWEPWTLNTDIQVAMEGHFSFKFFYPSALPDTIHESMRWLRLYVCAFWIETVFFFTLIYLELVIDKKNEVVHILCTEIFWFLRGLLLKILECVCWTFFLARLAFSLLKLRSLNKFLVTRRRRRMEGCKVSLTIVVFRIP